MILILYILLALLLDWLIGDPRWLPHPVKLIGALAMKLERPLRERMSSARMAGVVTAGIVVGVTALVSWGILLAAGRISPWLERLVTVVMLYTTFAPRDLARHAQAVLAELKKGDLVGAKRQVARIVGRDTEQLDEQGVIRATVESVAENTVDGVIAPLFFAFLGGPVAAMAYKAVSTLDSTFGYRNERYIDFGWASARLDDLVNLIPARLSVLFMALIAWIQDLDGGRCMRTAWQDGAKHASPNAGLAEASMAGALGVQLGGPVMRHGREDRMPTFGEPVRPLVIDDIQRACRLMAGTTAAGFFALAVLRILVIWVM